MMYYDSSWVILGAEESKALGEGAPDETGGGQPDEEEPIDIGKNMWYYSFDMLQPGCSRAGWHDQLASPMYPE